MTHSSFISSFLVVIRWSVQRRCRVARHQAYTDGLADLLTQHTFYSMWETLSAEKRAFTSCGGLVSYALRTRRMILMAGWLEQLIVFNAEASRLKHWFLVFVFLRIKKASLDWYIESNRNIFKDAALAFCNQCLSESVLSGTGGEGLLRHLIKQVMNLLREALFHDFEEGHWKNISD